MNTAGASARFAQIIRSLEEATAAPDPRTDVDTASLVRRNPELGRVGVTDVTVQGSHGLIAGRRYLPNGTLRAGLVWAHGGSFIGGNLDMPESNWGGLEGDLSDPYAFPSHANLVGMPPICIINSEWDDHRLSGEAFARQAVDAGIRVDADYEPGSRHGHLDRPHDLQAQRSIARIGDWLDNFSTRG